MNIIEVIFHTLNFTVIIDMYNLLKWLCLCCELVLLVIISLFNIYEQILNNNESLLLKKSECLVSYKEH